jgi:hypothetical protein
MAPHPQGIKTMNAIKEIFWAYQEALESGALALDLFDRL